MDEEELPDDAFFAVANVDIDIHLDAQPVVNLEKSPLYIFYDCETTGLSIYKDHLTEMAAEVVFSENAPTLTQPTYSSLVRTTRRIPALAW